MFSKKQANLNSVIEHFKKKMCTDRYPNVVGGIIGFIKVLGEGSFGKVFKACYPLKTVYQHVKKKKVLFLFTTSNVRYEPVCYPDALIIAVKVQPIEEENIQFISSNLYEKMISKSSIWCEYAVLKASSLLVKHKICPFFCSYVNIALCEKDHQSFLFMNYQDGSLHDYLQQVKITEELLFSIFVQVLIALYSLYANFEIVHNDLHSGNILYHTIPKEDCLGWEFRWREGKFIVPNEGILFVLSDFGLAARKEVFYNPMLKIKFRSSNFPRVFRKKNMDLLYFLYLFRDVIEESIVLDAFIESTLYVLKVKPNDDITIEDYGNILQRLLDHPLLKTFWLSSKNSSVYCFDLNKRITDELFIEK